MVYFIVFKYANTHTTFIQFVTGEYSKGNASLEFNLKNLLFTAINFMRSFIQIHGNIFDFIPSDSVLALFLLLLMLVLYYLIFKLKPWQTVRKIENNHYKLLFVLAFVIFHSFNQSAEEEVFISPVPHHHAVSELKLERGGAEFVGKLFESWQVCRIACCQQC